MKRLIPVFTVFSSLLLNAQTKNIQLNWADQNYLMSDGKSYNIPAFQSNLLYYNATSKVLTANVLIPNVVGNTLKVTSFKVEPIDLTKYPSIDKSNLPSQIIPKTTFSTFNGVVSAVVAFNPLIKSGSGYAKITDITFELTGTSSSKQIFQNINQTNSVLASGNWIRFKVNETGVYKIDKNLLNQLGVPQDVDPKSIKIYGHGGGMLPLANSENFNFDLPEIAIQVQGEQDGVLNDGDFVSFYGVGTKGWSDENATHLNLYSTDAYYYITYGGALGKRMQNYTEPTGDAVVTYNTYTARVFHEQDLVNIAQLSRKWFGEDFSSRFQLPFNFQMPLLDSSKPVVFGINVGAVSAGQTVFSYTVNGQPTGSKTLPAKGNGLGWEGYYKQEINLSGENNSVQVNFNNSGVPSAQGYVDFVSLDYSKHLAGYNKQFQFSFKDAVSNIGVGAFQIQNAGAITQLWDVSDPYNVTFKANTGSTVQLKMPLGVEKKFLAVDQNDYYVPTAIANSKVVNQNLKGTILANGNVDYLIITNNTLKPAADRLALLHQTKSGLNVRVVPVDVIYNEFSSGQQDIVAIRNFIRYVYEVGGKKLKYVNLFGDASTDFLNRIQRNNNQVPIFHLLDEKLSETDEYPLTSAKISNFSDQSNFSTDDFFALLDENEGKIEGNSYKGLDVAVGRMPVNTLAEANAMVRKIESYLDKDNAGRWKNNYLALADDVDGFSDGTLQEALNQMADELVANKPYYNVKKIYADAYQQQVVAGGPRYPKAKEEFLSNINSGSLVVNYLGHGSETGLGEERYLDLSDVDQLNNKDKYPLFAIVTCDFTRFENPLLESGGERLFLRENAGAIGILATSRKIGISSANDFTIEVSKWLFDYENNLPNVTIAEALMHTKNSTVNPSNEKGVISFIGDPALKLAAAKPNVVITHVNETALENFTGSLRALDRIKLKGQVTTENGQLISNFNGNLAVQLFDKNQDKVTLVNDGIGSPMSFKTLGETIFRGNATVTNGIFEIEFVVPKDIKIAVGEGKASFYAVKNSDILDDYTGANNALKIGGVNENAAEDNKAPQIKLFMNDESFISGGITNNAPLFLAHLEDENGMNTASGIGHDMVAILDGDENNPVVMNEFYETEPNNFMKGFVNYPFRDLKEGLHTITFKAWDVYNNLATATLDFVVAASSGLQLDKVLNYPNPFVDYTEFWFQHNRPNETLQAQVQILTVSGKIVKTINQTVVSDGILSKEIKWDGRDDFGDKIGKGVYIYRLKVKSTISGEQAEKIEKLVIL